MNFFATTKKNAVLYLAVAAVFLLVLREHQPVKWSDVIFAVTGALVLASRRGRFLLREFFPKAKFYAIAQTCLIAFILLGQFVAFREYGLTLPIKDILVDYGRLFFDAGVFMLVAFLVYTAPKMTGWLGAAAFASPFIIAPAWFGAWRDLVQSGGRLAGFMQNPIIFGSWLMVAFMAGAGLFFRARNLWAKVGIMLGLFAAANFVAWSGTRSAWVGLVSAIVICSIFYFRRSNFKNGFLFIAVSALALAAGYLALAYFPSTRGSGIQPAVESRAKNLVTDPLYGQVLTKVWREASPSVLDNFLGLGFGNYEGVNLFLKGTHSSSNTFLEITLAGGIGALASFLLILWKMGAAIKSALGRIGSAGADIKLAWFAIFFGLLADIFFIDGLFLRHVWVVFGIVLGTALQSNGGAEGKPSSAEARRYGEVRNPLA